MNILFNQLILLFWHVIKIMWTNLIKNINSIKSWRYSTLYLWSWWWWDGGRGVACGRENWRTSWEDWTTSLLRIWSQNCTQATWLVGKMSQGNEKNQNSRVRKSLRFLLKFLLKMLPSWSLNKKKQKIILLFQKYLFLNNTLPENFLIVGYSLSPALPCYSQHTRLCLSSL